MADFEWWETIYELKQDEDWPGLIRYYQSVVRRNPNDYYAKIGLGEAYVLNGQYQEAIHLLAGVHREIPESGDPKHYILEALFALGKDEDDFEWVEKPVVLRLDQTILDQCYNYLRPKRKPRSISEICLDCFLGDYLVFSEEELFEALKADPRFKVEGRSSFDSDISVQRRRRR